MQDPNLPTEAVPTEEDLDRAETSWFRAAPTLAAPSLDEIRARVRSSMPPPPLPMGDDEVDAWLS
jgi:hypothetical protein